MPVLTQPGRDRHVPVWSRHSLMLAVVACLLALAAANISLRAAWHELEDGVLWVARQDGVAAAEVASRGPGEAAGIRPGDILLAINGRPVESASAVVAALHGGVAGQTLEYTVLGNGTRGLKRVALQPVPQGQRALYFVLAAVAIFTLIVGAAVRVGRPGDPAALHFFWLSVAFFGVFAFSFSGRLDRLDWTFYWADVAAMALLPPMFLHFALAFPERAQAWIHSETGRRIWPLFYVPAALMVVSRVAAISGAFGDDPSLTRLLASLDRLELVQLAAGLVAGFAVMAVALRRARSVTARRQLRWIVWGTALGAFPFVLAYVVPFVLGWELVSRVELLALPLGLVPLAFASAVVRYRLMDVEVIFKRGIVYATLGSAMVAIYAVTLKLATEVFLGGSDEHVTVIAVLATLVAVLLAPVMKNAVQATFDRAYYRDRYDYRRALVAFARDLNSDLDLERLATKLVERVRQTLALERMALLITPAGVSDYWVVLRAEGFEADALLRLDATGGVGGRVQQGQAVSFDDPLTARRFSSEEVHRWRDAGVHVFLPCVSKEGTIAVMALGPKESGEPLNSEDMTLLNAVAGQVATAIENGRLYHQLRVKADELNRLRQFSENIIASLTDGLIVVGLDDRVVRWNAAMEGLYGVSRTAAVGQPLEALFDGPFVAALKSAREAQDEVGTAFRVPLTSRHGEPRLLLVNAAATPLRTPDGAVAGTIVIVEDTTARVKLEEQLQISDKMASIGLLAAGVAHEVNTPLTGISSYTQMLLDGIAPDDPRAPLLEKIERQTFRAAKIVNGLLNFARPSQSESGPVDLHTVINDVLSLLEHQLRGGSIQLRKDLAPESPLVMGVEHKLQQVFINLFLNARDAMPSGGWLSIGTRLDDDVAVIEVSDTGQGIPTDQLARIYDPFFTTKAIGQGTGLGLSITYGIVQEHHGTIACDSRAGQGTKFILRLPLAVAARERVGQAAK